MCCSWCEEAPAEGGTAFCGECEQELLGWDNDALARMLGVLQTLANVSKRAGLFSREIAGDPDICDEERIEQVRALVCEWRIARDRRGRVFPGVTCSNCGVPWTRDGESGLCAGCHQDAVALDRAELVRRLGSAASEAVYWRTVVMNAREAISAEMCRGARLRVLRRCLEEPID